MSDPVLDPTPRPEPRLVLLTRCVTVVLILLVLLPFVQPLERREDNPVLAVVGLLGWVFLIAGGSYLFGRHGSPHDLTLSDGILHLPTPFGSRTIRTADVRAVRWRLVVSDEDAETEIVLRSRWRRMRLRFDAVSTRPVPVLAQALREIQAHRPAAVPATVMPGEDDIVAPLDVQAPGFLGGVIALLRMLWHYLLGKARFTVLVVGGVFGYLALVLFLPFP
ncbi:hypothetical protein [Kineosporia sp. NBRC 101731]|uniref:hypothetical protein n=1 Tax=Kineosporia sp. NBRC 101731 TaxID=3032199 RepID=UPI0024A03F85|nr:hypothetical protein [Kineosporia sp. NBRC 101731]GLY29328.1 hypothetical protein Kisp02_26930 [Kineosporia sp. NBRC 101731]